MRRQLQRRIPQLQLLSTRALGPGHVAGVGGYAFINDLLYLELTGYRSLNLNAQTKLGIDPFGVGMIEWRGALLARSVGAALGQSLA